MGKEKCGFEHCLFVCKHRPQLKRHRIKENHIKPDAKQVISSDEVFLCRKCKKKFTCKNDAYRHSKQCKATSNVSVTKSFNTTLN